MYIIYIYYIVYINTYHSIPSSIATMEEEHLVPSAPPLSPELRRLENQVNIVELSLITSEIEYYNYEIKKIEIELVKTDMTKCDEQCQQANQSVESNTVDDILKKINDIFNK